MISFFVSIAILILGYFTWGALTERFFAPDDRETPAIAINDGVDCIPISTPKAFLIQLLNIAGTGPIFGALMGAVFGPVVFLWIVFGSILGGAVHDYYAGMISSRNDGKSLAELSGIYIDRFVKWIMRVFTIVLLIFCGTVFITSPAALLSGLTPAALNQNFWIVVILIYYILATILPIDKLIAKIYPFFGMILIIMAVGIIGGLFVGGYHIPEVTLQNLHPDNLPLFPFMFVTVACGAISGFHSTQSPMMAKCIKSEREGRKVFYGAMLTESVIALVWAAAGVAFYGATHMLSDALSEFGQSGVVYNISTSLLGPVGGILAIVGVVICPISSGDTAFRAARLTLSEWAKLDQKPIKNRLFIALPMFVIAAVLTQINFDVLWRYFSWSNQTLATISLWVSTAYLIKSSKHPFTSLITALPSAFMTFVIFSYILMAPEGFALPADKGYPTGIIAAAVFLVGYFVNITLYIKKNKTQ